MRPAFKILSDQAGGGGAHLTNAESIYETRQRNRSSFVDGGKQVFDRLFAPAFAFFQLQPLAGVEQVRLLSGVAFF